MNPAQLLRPVAVLVIMIGAALAAVAIRPARPEMAAQASFHLGSIVPERFGDWHIDPDEEPILPSSQLQAAIDRAYEQTLDRTYVDSRGRSIMLSIAFSGDYNKGMQWHRPENCYPSQGFALLGPTVPVDLQTKLGPLIAAQLVAKRGERVEPITYWFVLGNRQARFGLDLRWHQVLYGLTGRIPDGLLVRVSSIDKDAAAAFAAQRDFAADLVAAIPDAQRRRFVGDAEGAS